MKLIEGYWRDERGNKWNADRFSREEAVVYSRSLIDCDQCVNCADCSYCFECSDCHYCHHCRACVNCWRCSLCSDCRECFGLLNLTDRYKWEGGVL